MFVINLIILSVAAVLISGLLDRKSKIIMANSPKYSRKGIAISTFLVFLLSLFIFSIFNSALIASAVIFPMVVLLSLINHIKIKFRNEPFVANDILIITEAANVAGSFKLVFPLEAYAAVVVLAGLISLNIFINSTLGLIQRLALMLVLLFFIYFTFFSKSMLINKIIKPNKWNLNYEYNKNGFILGFLLSIRQVIYMNPPLFADEIHKIVTEDLPETLPNVIVIMNESYYDPKNLTDISFNSDPMEAVRGIMAEHGCGNLLTPQFGGGTANVEYEFLTGNSTIFYPINSIIYNQYIKTERWSLAKYFRQLGYMTTAIHPYEEWFWKRNKVYPLLGFEKMFFKKNMANTEICGEFISDMSVSKEIIEKYNAHKDKPFFNFSVTMQNHGGYMPERYNNRKITAINNKRSTVNNEASVFFEGIRHASEGFEMLTKYFENIEHPTYILMFGDHAPYFVKNLELYKDDKLTDDNIFSMYTSPVLIWSNTGKRISDCGTVSPFMLTNKLLDILKMPKTEYLNRLEKLSYHTSGFNNNFALDYKGMPANSATIQNWINYMENDSNIL